MNRIVFIFIYFLAVIACNRGGNEPNKIQTIVQDKVKQTVDTMAGENDSSGCIKHIKNFLQWYKVNIDELHRIELAKRVGKDSIYRVDFKDADSYLSILRESGYFADDFLLALKKYFETCDKYYIKTKETEWPPYGLNSDLILQTQEYDEFLDNIAKLKFKIENQSTTYSVIKMSYFYTYWIIKCDVQCRIKSMEIGQEDSAFGH